MTSLPLSENRAALLDSQAENSLPIWLVTADTFTDNTLPSIARNWAKAQNFKAKAGTLLVLGNGDGQICGALFGIEPAEKDKSGEGRLISGKLARLLPAGIWHIATPVEQAELFATGFLLGGYQFNRYKKDDQSTEYHSVKLFIPGLKDAQDIRRIADASAFTRDLINTPTSDMGPDRLEQQARLLAETYGANFSAITGDALLEKNFPMIHAVGRASTIAPRLIDFSWGKAGDPKVTLVGKGVCFDTGGLDIKTASGMLLMKKDMGGGANVLGLARMIMDAGLPVRLRVLIPAVENSIAGNAFRPGDVLTSRQGLTVEIGNTDAEGRLVLADALACADEENPDLLIDMATLTGAARVALGPDLPPFYSHDEGFAAQVAEQAAAQADPLWHMPLWEPYLARLSSRIADINNSTTDGFAGSVTAALFLSRFVKNAKIWGHFDIYGWTPVEKPAATIGGAAQGIRTLYHVIKQRFGAAN